MSEHTETKPAGATGPTGSRRVERRLAPQVGAVILADISSSMETQDQMGRDGFGMGERRIDRLARVLDYILTRYRVQRLICFHDLPIEIELVGKIALPEPAGSTNLTLALEHVRSIVPVPDRLILISDGIPNSPETALAVARLLRPMIIDAYYVGPDRDYGGGAFMNQLAACGGPGGRSGHFDMADPLLLGREVEERLLLSARKP